jgi:hypothetical protein
MAKKKVVKKKATKKKVTKFRGGSKKKAAKRKPTKKKKIAKVDAEEAKPAVASEAQVDKVLSTVAEEPSETDFDDGFEEQEDLEDDDHAEDEGYF